MERVLSQDERIRRAEEIYARRQNARERTSRATVNISSSEPKNFKLFKRLALQALICLLIYFIFHLINTTNYSFSKATLDKTEDLISYEVDFVSIYNNIANAVSSYITSLNLGIGNNIKQAVLAENIIDENTVFELNNQETNTNEINEENIIDVNSNEISYNNDSNITNIAVINNEEDTAQEEIRDVKLSETDRIKQKYSFVVPVKRLDFF